MLQKPYHIFTPNNLLDFLTAIASILAILVTCEPIYHIYLSGVGCLFSFSAFRMGAYSRWALIRGWALTRRNVVSVWIHLHVTTRFFARGRAAGHSGVNNLRGLPSTPSQADISGIQKYETLNWQGDEEVNKRIKQKILFKQICPIFRFEKKPFLRAKRKMKIKLKVR